MTTAAPAFATGTPAGAPTIVDDITAPVTTAAAPTPCIAVPALLTLAPNGVNPHGSIQFIGPLPTYPYRFSPPVS